MENQQRYNVHYRGRNRSRSRSRERIFNVQRRIRSQSRSLSPQHNFISQSNLSDHYSTSEPLYDGSFYPTDEASYYQQGIPPNNIMVQVADKTELELFVGNTPPGTSEFVLLNFLNAAMSQVNLDVFPGPPILQCRVSNKYAFIELRSREETNNALSLNGIPFMGTPLKVGRPSKYRGPHVEASTWQTLTGAGAISGLDPATKVYRELYVGNTNNLMTETSMGKFLGMSLQKVGLATSMEGNPVVAARSNGNFFFIELRSVEDANAMLNLNGIPYMGQNLKISRPSKYPGPTTPSVCWPDIVARLMTQGEGAILAGDNTNPYGADSRDASPTNTPIATNVLRLNNMLTANDLADEQGLADIEEETKQECTSFGKVKNVHIVRPSTTDQRASKVSTGVGYVFIEFEEVDSARKAMLSLSTRTFDGKKVEVTFWDEKKFRDGIYGD